MANTNDMTEKSKLFHWKGRYVSESVYNQRKNQSSAAKKRKLTSEVPADPGEQSTYVVDGRRIVDLTVLANGLECSSCKEILSLKYIESELRHGLASIFTIRCHHCLYLTKVPTDKKNNLNEDGHGHYSVNLKAALGTLYSGVGYTHLNKLLASLNIPYLHSMQFKKYEDTIGNVVEVVARKSCEEAVKLERSLTIDNLDCLQAMLPDNLPRNFLVPTRTAISECWSDIDIDENDIVRLMTSYDMGWSKRGTGRNYDSLNRYGALSGSESKRILDFGTRNRKCRACDRGVADRDHDCRRNYEGSAKAMESDLAVDLCTQSSILKGANTEVGILVGDDDSSTIAAVRKAIDHPIVKLSDKNHAAKGVKSALYTIKKQHKELTKEAIDYLHRCFTYAISENQGKSSVIAEILQQIPDHCFNKHENCGLWCRYKNDKDNYKHSSIPGGFTSSSLHEALVHIFAQLAKNVDKFAHGTSSQRNENLNAVMASKAPKSRCYSLSASSDYRFSLTVASQNLGADCIQAVMKSAELSPGKHTSKYTRFMETIANQRRQKIVTTTFKTQRHDLKKRRELLRKKKELTEGIRYQSNMGLLQYHATTATENTYTETVAIVFFDLETSSLMKTADVLQIGARYRDESFGVYVNPTKPIAPSASAVNGFENVNGELFLHGKRVMSWTLRTALQAFCDFLLAIGRPCVLAAHNCKFDSARLLRSIELAGMLGEFDSAISGFTDTLPVFKKILQRNNNCSQTALASELLQLSDDGAHGAVRDVEVLQMLVAHLQIPDSVLIENKKTTSEILEQEAKVNLARDVEKSLTPLKGVISGYTIGKIASAAITFTILVDTFLADRETGINVLFAEEISGKPRVTNSLKVIDAVKNFLSSTV